MREQQTSGDKKKAVEIHMAERADEIKIQIVKIKADKELALKELELKAQQDQASTSLAEAPPLPPLPHLHYNKDAKSRKL